MTTEKEKWVSVSELADYLGVCKDTIYTWLSDKNMPAIKAGRLWKFKISVVENWLANGGASSAAAEKEQSK